jgi:integrase/recombinase XerD
MTIPHHPQASLYTQAGQRKYLTADERARFLCAALDARPEVQTLCMTLIHTGCRISEALALTGHAVERADGFVTIHCLKKRKAGIYRDIPVPPALSDKLTQIHGLDQAPGDARLWPFSRSRAWRLVKQVMAKAGIAAGPHATPKGLRHSYALHAIRSGVPLHLVQRWLGHASMTTTAIYLQAIGAEEREIAARMWGG